MVRPAGFLPILCPEQPTARATRRAYSACCASERLLSGPIACSGSNGSSAEAAVRDGRWIATDDEGKMLLYLVIALRSRFNDCDGGNNPTESSAWDDLCRAPC